jgi:hypothetical protein
MHGVEMPIDFIAIVKVAIAQKPETMAANFVRLRHNRRRLIWQMFTQERNAPRKFTRGKEKVSWRFGRETQPVPARLQSNSAQGDVESL